MRLRLPFHATLNSRLWLAFVLIIVIPVAVLGTLLVFVSERALVRNAADQSNQTIEQLASGLDEEARQIALWAAAIASDDDLLSAGDAFALGRTESSRAIAAQSLDSRMTSFFNYTNKIGSVQLFFRTRAPYIYRNSSFLFEQQLDRGPWYDDVVGNPGHTQFVQDLRSYSLGGRFRPLLSVAISPLPRRAEVALLLVSFRVPALDAFYDGVADRRELMLADAAARPIYSTSDGVITPGQPLAAGTVHLLDALAAHRSDTGDRGLGNASFRLDILKKPYLVTIAEVPSPNWLLVSAVPLDEITRSIDRFVRLARYALLLLVALFVAFIEVSFHEVIRPLRQVIGRMREVQAGNYSVAVEVGGPEEIARLGSTFNSMVREVGRLTAEKESNERKRAELELEALRLQINPHFLSNTLNSIRLMAIMTKAHNIQEMTAALMKVVTDSFSRNTPFDCVGNEVEMLKSYILIMKIRYGDSFTVTYDMEPGIEELFMLRMLLQPIVENSILHGFQDLPRKGKIEVSARIADGGLRIDVVDNGVGMTPEIATNALVPDGHDSLGLTRVGLVNVERRIKLNHGEQFGLSIESREGSGTSVLIRLPIITKEARDVPRDGR